MGVQEETQQEAQAVHVAQGVLAVRQALDLAGVIAFVGQPRSFRTSRLCLFSLSWTSVDLRSMQPPNAAIVLAPLVLPAPSARKTDRPRASQPIPMQRFDRE